MESAGGAHEDKSIEEILERRHRAVREPIRSQPYDSSLTFRSALRALARTRGLNQQHKS
jgi:hypothetical protein